MAKILGYSSIGLDPKVMGLGPIKAIQKALEKAELTVEDIDLFEVNEAFASQSIAVVRELGLDPEKVNVNGGAIAIGHPIGASGARILVTLLHEMKKTQGQIRRRIPLHRRRSGNRCCCREHDGLILANHQDQKA